MEASGSMDLADNALARATQVFVKVWIDKQFGLVQKCCLYEFCLPSIRAVQVLVPILEPVQL